MKLDGTDAEVFTAEAEAATARLRADRAEAALSELERCHEEAVKSEHDRTLKAERDRLTAIGAKAAGTFNKEILDTFKKMAALYNDVQRAENDIINFNTQKVWYSELENSEFAATPPTIDPDFRGLAASVTETIRRANRQPTRNVSVARSIVRRFNHGWQLKTGYEPPNRRKLLVILLVKFLKNKSPDQQKQRLIRFFRCL